jgi:hypothetical protein
MDMSCLVALFAGGENNGIFVKSCSSLTQTHPLTPLTMASISDNAREGIEGIKRGETNVSLISRCVVFVSFEKIKRTLILMG